MIETARLILRPFREGDTQDLFENLRESIANCFASMKTTSLEKARKVVMEPGIFPGWHMNKAHWLTVALEAEAFQPGELKTYPRKIVTRSWGLLSTNRSLHSISSFANILAL